jgi:hypothetical protein
MLSSLLALVSALAAPFQVPAAGSTAPPVPTASAPAVAPSAAPPVPGSGAPAVSPAAGPTAAPAAAASAEPAPAATDEPPPAHGPSIVPPPGWKKRDVAPSMGGLTFLGFWMAPADKSGFTDNINLGRQKSPVAYDAYIKANREILLSRFAKSFAKDADESCGPGKAHRFAYETVFGSIKLALVQLMRMDDGWVSIATYTRVATRAADPAALASLRSLCKYAPVTLVPERFIKTD